MPTSSNRTMLIAAAVILVLAVVGAVVVLHRHPAAPPAPPAPKVQPATVQPAPVEAQAPAGDCPPPASAPPMAPDGTTATAAQMQAGRQKAQAFVNQLEIYQACRNSQVDHAGPMVTEAQKQAWTDAGNGAVDEANLLAHAFSVQLQTFNARGGH